MIISFARLQRLSQLERPSAIKRWLQKRAIAYLTDTNGNPFTTLDALNRRLYSTRTNNHWTEEPRYAFGEPQTRD